MGILPTSPDRGNISFVPPTKTFSDQMDVDISDVKLKLIHVQGASQLTQTVVPMTVSYVIRSFMPYLDEIRGSIYS